jgi:hypothetical protein
MEQPRPEPAVPVSSRPEKSWACAGPPKVMKNGSCSATSLPEEPPSPLVIPTGAKRSGGTCGLLIPWLSAAGRLRPSPLSSRPKRSEVERSLSGYSVLEMFFDRAKWRDLPCAPRPNPYHLFNSQRAAEPQVLPRRSCGVPVGMTRLAVRFRKSVAGCREDGINP